MLDIGVIGPPAGRSLGPARCGSQVTFGWQKQAQALCFIWT